MNRHYLFGAIALAACGVAHANDAIISANNEVSFVVGALNQNYHETSKAPQLTGPYLDSESGVQPAAQLAVSRQASLFGISNVYTAASVSVAAGHSSYSGFAIAPANFDAIGKPATQNKRSFTADVDLRLGKSFTANSSGTVQLTPYLFYGYHNWSRDKIERYSHDEIGIGMLGQYSLSSSVVLSLDLNVSRTFAGLVQSTHGVDERLGSAYSPSLLVGADYALTKRLHLVAHYQVKRFSYGASASVTGEYAGMSGSWYEPASRTLQQSFMIGAAWSF